MPLPNPQPDDTKDEFVDRFMANPTAIEDFPDVSQRRAVAEQRWESRGISNISVQLNASQATEVEFKGRPHLKVPAVLLREMVLQGAGGYEDGPAFLPFDEIQSSKNLWNGAPIVLGHAITGRDANEIDRRYVGTVFDATTDPQNKTLKANLYFDIERLQNASVTDFLGTHDGQKILQKLQSGKMVELSTGYPAQKSFQSGTYNGKSYNTIQKNIFPDHLGVFSDIQGACSIKDGCGVNRLNANGNIIDNQPEDEPMEDPKPVLNSWDKFKQSMENWLSTEEDNPNNEPGGTMSQNANREELVEFIRNNSDIELPDNVVEDTENYSDCRLNGLKQGIEATKPAEEPVEEPEPQEPTVEKEAVLNALGVNADEFEAIRNSVRDSEAAKQAEKERLAKAIHDKQIYNLSKDELEKTPLETLKAMAPNGQTDFSVNGGADVDDDVPMPPNVLGRAAYNAAQKAKEAE